MTGNKGGKPVDEKMREKIALHRWAVIAEAASERLSSSDPNRRVERRALSTAK